MGAAPAGTVTLHFTSLGSATLAYTINGASGTKAIARLPFGATDSTPVASYGDLWWGGVAQNGWGLSINQQYRTLFSVWYTYDAAGRNVWYVVPSGQWTSETSFAGTAYRANGSAWLGRPYDASAFSTTPVGRVTLSFSDPGHAAMSYAIDGVSQSKPIERVPF